MFGVAACKRRGGTGGFLLLFGLVVIYFDDGRILLVTDGRLFMIWVVLLLQTGVAACVLLLGNVFL